MHLVFDFHSKFVVAYSKAFIISSASSSPPSAYKDSINFITSFKLLLSFTDILTKSLTFNGSLSFTSLYAKIAILNKAF